MKIDITKLQKALKSLQTVLSKELDSENIIRDSTIQRFEYTFELSIKLLARELENILPVKDEVARMPYPTLIRTAAEKGLIENPVTWFDYREKRNITSHTYEEEKAEQVYEMLPDFVKDVEFLINSIKNLNNKIG